MAEALRTPPQDDALVKARRRQIFLAACRVLSRKSFHEASVKELALEAGLAAGSIYVYLQGKEDILILIAESMVAGNSWINAHNVFAYGLPYGGVNLSGFGGGVNSPETFFDYLRNQTIARPLA